MSMVAILFMGDNALEHADWLYLISPSYEFAIPIITGRCELKVVLFLTMLVSAWHAWGVGVVAAMMRRTMAKILSLGKSDTDK